MLRAAALCAFTLGGVGFLSGFLGPLALSPEANQGPLLGIFITGPAGVVIGIVLGSVLAAVSVSPSGFRVALASACAIMTATTLFYSTPEPEYRGGILDAEIRGCSPPSSRREQTLTYWEEELSRTSPDRVRAGWREDFDRMLTDERAVVLQLRVVRRCAVYENRKPWNRGTLEVRPLRSKDSDQTFFATYAGGSCDAYHMGTRSRFVTRGQTSHEWPPEILANLLDLQTVEPAPEKYVRLVGD
jgi:hypothetical protein